MVAQVRASAIKNIERALTSGTHYASARIPLPARVGVDAVVTLPVGRRVYTGMPPPGGAMAERIAVDPRTVVEVPHGLDDAAAAALPNPGVSAWLALEHAGRIQPGQCVLVLGGTGVTGGLAAQLARHRFDAGRVVVAGRNPDRLRRLHELGCADATIHIGDNGGGAAALPHAVARMHAERPFDLILDYLWGVPAEQTLHALAGDDLAAEAHRIRYVQVGEMAGSGIELRAAVLRSAGIELVGQGGGSLPREALAKVGSEILPALFTMLADHTIGIETIIRPLSQVTAAWAEPVPSGARVVLTPLPDTDQEAGP